MSRPQLGIMAAYFKQKKLEEIDYFQMLARRGRQLGLDVLVFGTEDVRADKPAVHALTYDSNSGKWVRRWTVVPDLIYDRCRYKSSLKYEELKVFRNRFPKLLYLGLPLANKWKIYKSMNENEQLRPHLPLTKKFSSVRDTIKFVKKHKQVYLKPRSGTGGRGIIRVEKTSSGRYLLQGRDEQRAILTPEHIREGELASRLHAFGLSNQYLLQQGIDVMLPGGLVHDFRVLIQKNGRGQWKVTGCAGRIGPPRSITSNLHGGGTASQAGLLLARRFDSTKQIDEIKEKMHELAYLIVQHLESNFGELCELGIDLAVDPSGGVWLLEVNPKPSREVFRNIGQHRTYRKAVSQPLKYALWLYRKRKQRLTE